MVEAGNRNYVAMSDYEALERELKEYKEAAEFNFKQYQDAADEMFSLIDERDALAAYCDELKVVAQKSENAIHEWVTSHPDDCITADNELLSIIDGLLKKSPQISLAEHDARVIEEFKKRLAEQ